ncbi:restriction endonuclease subunit S [Silvania hatchlandensis]|uniref:Restriction endonuclease subunit S n=1 Tax=Silvania hatchlandensis TaxID=2926469 RepID=A0A9J6Q5N6_9ENTR|nr:restriction endonuclease subunit S [Silvania hatchlandensis]MCU6667008.1 restriction endonuclease subunit S [Silvania hatchlandensis]
MAKYKAYPEYKDSGVEWLGEVPLNWHIHSLKRAIDSCTNGVWGGEPDDKHDLIVLRVADFERQSFKISDLKLTTRSILPKDRGSRLLKKGDLLIEKSGGGDKTLVGCVVLFDKEYEAVTSNFVAKMSPRESYDSHFLTYAFSQLYAGKVNYPSIKQTTGIQNLDADAYLMEKFCFPPMHEQRNISCFLDHETAKIDNLIEKQQQLIELLKEKRQAVISHAVTKGLNPDVPMKDSGVEWLGEVPAHWDSVRVKQVSSFITSGPRGWSDYITDDGDEIFLQSGDLNNELGLHLDKAKRVSPPKNAEGVRTRLMNGDVVICITGANTGRVAIVSKLSQKTYINQHLSLIRPETPKINSSFLGYCLTSSNGRSYFEVAQYGLKEGLNLSNIAEAPLALPPLHEQDAIVKYLKCVQNNYDYLSCLSANQVGLLQERRTALISAAVTGKIDVRDWVAPETQDIEEPQEATA